MTIAQKAWYARNKERIAELNKDPVVSEKRKEARLKYQRTDKGRATARRKEFKSAQRKSRVLLRHAIRDGKITRGTCHCGKVGEGHHEDYDKPLEVIWLCREHHREVHNEHVSRVKYPAGYVG